MREDVRRIVRGGQPIGYAETAVALAAGARVGGRARGPFFLPSSAAVSPAPQRGFWERVGADLRMFAATIPRLPFALAEEVRQIPRVPGIIGHALREGPREAVREIAAAPGIRMIPGAFVTESLATPGGAGMLAQHPVFTALDVLPVANRVTHSLTGRSLRAEAGAGIRALEARLETRPNLYRWTPTQILDRMGIGPRVRTMSAIEARETQALRKRFAAFSEQVDAKVKEFGIVEADVEAFARLELQGTREAWAALNDRQRGFLRWYQVELQRQLHRGFAEGYYYSWGNEIYSRQEHPALLREVSRFKRAEERAGFWSSKIEELTDAIGQLMAEGTPVKGRGRFGGELGKARGKLSTARKRLAMWEPRRDAAHARADELAVTRPPARFRPLLAEQMRSRFRAAAGPAGSIPDWERIIAYVNEGYYSFIPGIDSSVVRQIAAEANASWQGLRAAGLNPLFMHHLGREALGQIVAPRVIVERAPLPSQVKKRATDMRPWIPDVSLALRHMELEWLRREHSRVAVERMIDAGIIKPADDVRRAYVERGTQYAEAHGEPLSRHIGRGRIDAQISRDWIEFDPESIYPFRRAGVQFRGGLMLPRSIAGAIDIMRTPATAWKKALDVPMGAFRTSVLALSPSYYLHNVISGALMLGMRSDPTVFRFFRQAYQMIRENRVPDELARGTAAVPADVARWQKAAWEAAGGRTLGRLWNEAGRARGATTQPLWAFAQLIDDMYRVMGYLHGKTRGVRRGLSREAAHAAGLELAQKAMVDWSRLTPVEREVIRYAIPFYGWIRFLLGYTFSYPFDHPVRAAIISNFARTEFADWGSGLPERLQSLLMFGKPDAGGKIRALPLGGPVPFLTVPSYFSLAGLLAHANPLVEGMLQTFGLDPVRAGPELHPDLGYDPVSGSLVMRRPPPWRTFLPSIIPQAGALQDVVFATRDMRELRERDPDAFRRRLLQSFGLWAPTRIGLTEIAERAERRRFERARHALTELVKGRPREAEQYPAFARFVELMESRR
jgi:hypothetical protein